MMAVRKAAQVFYVLEILNCFARWFVPKFKSSYGDMGSLIKLVRSSTRDAVGFEHFFFRCFVNPTLNVLMLPRQSPPMSQ
jgi:hypothetical protein